MTIQPSKKSEVVVTNFKFNKAGITASIREDLTKQGYTIKEMNWNTTNTSLDVTAEKPAEKSKK